jgi:hypothetical protein
MIYTTTYINKVLSRAYCCMGTMGIGIDKELRYGVKCTDIEALLSVRLAVFALESWEQEEDGLTYSEDNVLTIEERDALIDEILLYCCCSTDVENQEIISLDTDYWRDGYTVDDSGNDSYNG